MTYLKTQRCLQKATTAITGPCKFFFCIGCFSVNLTMEIGTTDALKVRWGPVGGRRQRQRAQTTRLALFGPQVSFLKSSSCFFLYLTIYIATTGSLKVRCGSTQAKTTTTGPNDASRIVWAQVSFFFPLFIAFLLLITNVNRFSNDGTQTMV